MDLLPIPYLADPFIHRGKKAIHDNDGMLSLVAKTSAAPTQPSPFKLSLLDLAEAADELSRKQSSSKQAQQADKPQTHLTGPVSARKRNAGHMEDALDYAAAASPTMLTRAQLRQQGSNLYEAVMAADATALPPLPPAASPPASHRQPQSSMAADRPWPAHKQPKQNSKASTELRAATMLPNGGVLAHLPLSQQGQQEALPEHTNQNKKTSKAKGKSSAAAAPTSVNAAATTAPESDAAAIPAAGTSSNDAATATAQLQAGASDTPAAKKQKKDKHKGTAKSLGATDSQARPYAAPALTAAPVPQAAAALDKDAADQEHKYANGKDSRTQAGLSQAHLPAPATAAASLDQMPAGHAQQGTASAQQDTANTGMQPAKKQKKHKRDKAEAAAKATALADSQHTHLATAAHPSTADRGRATASAALDLAPAQLLQHDQAAPHNEQPAKKVKKRKHRSKDPHVTAEAPAAAQTDTIDASSAAAALPVVTSPSANTAAAMPQLASLVTDATAVADRGGLPAAEGKKHKRKGKKPVKASGIEHDPSSAQPGVIWPTPPGLPAEPAVSAELDDPDVPAEPAGPIPKHKKRKPKAAGEPAEPAEPVEPVEPAHKRKKHKSKSAADSGREPTADAEQMLPEASGTQTAEHELEAHAEASAAAGEASAAEEPPPKAKRSRKPKASKTAEPETAGTEAGEEAAPKPKRGRPPKAGKAKKSSVQSQASPGQASGAAGGPVSWREGMHPQKRWHLAVLYPPPASK